VQLAAQLGARPDLRDKVKAGTLAADAAVKMLRREAREAEAREPGVVRRILAETLATWGFACALAASAIAFAPSGPRSMAAIFGRLAGCETPSRPTRVAWWSICPPCSKSARTPPTVTWLMPRSAAIWRLLASGRSRSSAAAISRRCAC
jgi:hypothetical protein